MPSYANSCGVSEMKVIYENHLDIVVRLHSSLPPGKIGLAPWPEPEGDLRGEMPFGPNAGLTEVLVPAGYVRTALRRDVQIEPGQKALHSRQQQHADGAACARAAVLARVQVGAG